LYQLFDPFSGNLDLQPEENTSFEIGLVYKLKKWELSGTYFNRIESPSLIYDLATYRYENATDQARYYGVETVLSGSIGSKLMLDHQMTFTETRDGDLRYLPNFSAQTRLSYSFSKVWSVNFGGQFVGKRFGLDNTTVLEAYQLVNASVFYQFKNTPLKLFFHTTNLFNENYVEIEGYATRGRNVVVGLNYLFP
jgi:vitamin B12 transporter